MRNSWDTLVLIGFCEESWDTLVMIGFCEE